MKKNTMQRIANTMLILIGAMLVCTFQFSAGVQAQTGARVTFAMNPAIFRAGQPAAAELSVTSVSTNPLTLSPGNIFTFFLDSSVGAVSSFTTPISVSSASLLAGDFSVSFGANHSQINLTYNGPSKTFAFGDSVTVKISFTAGAQAGTGKLSLSSQFVSPVNGNLPFTTVSIVDFANPGLASVTHDQSLTGDGTPPSPLGIAPGGVTNADIAIGAVTAPDIAAGQVVKSLNGLEDNVSILAGTNVTVTPGPGSLTVSAPNLLSSVAHDSTLSGNGSSASPLGVAPQGIGTAQLADNSVTSAKIGPGQVVKSLNGVTDNVNITTDNNLVIAPAGAGLIIKAPNMLTTVAHDTSLTGNGTSGSPLSVAVAVAPSQQPVVFTTSFQIISPETTCQVGCAAGYTVPQGQRLVIQQLAATVTCGASPGQRYSAFAATIVLPSGFHLLFPIILSEQAPEISNENASFAGSQQVTIYVDAGQTVEFGGGRNDSSGTACFRFFMYGYLVPAP